MQVEVDLHLHTIFSDGTLTPAEIVRKAVNSGLKTISITDHDTTEGLADSKENANLYGVGFIPGIEIGTNINNKNLNHLFKARLEGLIYQILNKSAFSGPRIN